MLSPLWPNNVNGFIAIRFALNVEEPAWPRLETPEPCSVLMTHCLDTRYCAEIANANLTRIQASF